MCKSGMDKKRGDMLYLFYQKKYPLLDDVVS